MKKCRYTLLFLCFLTAVMVSGVVFVRPDAQRGITTIGSHEVEIAVDGSQVTIDGTAGQTLEVVSITGSVVKKIKIESSSYTFTLDVPKGCYILKVGTIVRKINIG